MDVSFIHDKLEIKFLILYMNVSMDIIGGYDIKIPFFSNL